MKIVTTPETSDSALRHQVETIALAVSKIRRLPSPDPTAIQALIVEAAKLPPSVSRDEHLCLLVEQVTEILRQSQQASAERQ